MTFEFTKNYKFTILNNENVWAKAMNRVVNEKVPVDKATDEMIARIKAVAGSPVAQLRASGGELRMSTAPTDRHRHASEPVPGPEQAARSRVADDGAILLAPYILVFLVFVVYPVGYGLWLARHPVSYDKLFEDPIFLRSVFNTLVFLIVGINLKMVVALLLSGFFVAARPWIKWLSLLFILPWAVPSIPTILSFRFMLNPEWGIINR